jgi:polyisoprenoid-binding protein YceI
MKWSRALLAGAAALTLAYAASARLEDAGDVEVLFLATGPARMKISGAASDLKASEKDGKLTITVPLTNLKTGIGLRDRHTRRYLHTDKYPEATLVVARSKLKFPENDKSTSSKATGDFTLNGVTKPLGFHYLANRTGSDYHVQALATVDIRDYDIKIPCYLGVCVDPEVKLKVKFKLREKR